MIDLFAGLFDTSDFPARWGCGRWTATLGWLHISSDGVTFLSYLSISCMLLYFASQRRDMTIPNTFWLFAAFIAACGATHLIDAVIFWWPAYRLSGLAKAVTAVVSLVTAVALVRVLPVALRYPSLEEVNRRLEEEVVEHIRTERRLEVYSKELERSNDELDRFAFAASHDLKAPLRAIDNLARWLGEDDGSLGEDSRRHLGLMQQRIARMEKLLDDMLDYSRAGRVHGETGDVDCGELVREVIELLAPPPGFRFGIAPDLPRLSTMRVPLEQCLRNLIGNAIKHHDRDDGRIRISWSRAEGMIVFEVADDGPGIAPEYHERIFRMFQTLRARDQVEGSGMGLAVIRKTAESYGGKVEVSSVPGEGATFRLHWPAEVPEVAMSA